MTGGIDIATIVRRCRDHSRIASVQLLNASIDVDLARTRPAPGETHRIYSVDLAPLGPERDLCRRCRCRRRSGRSGAYIEFRAREKARVTIPACGEHLAVGQQCRRVTV